MQDKVDIEPKRQRVFRRDTPGADLTINDIPVHNVIISGYSGIVELFRGSKTPKAIDTPFTKQQIDTFVDFLYGVGHTDRLDMYNVYKYFDVAVSDKYVRGSLIKASNDEIKEFINDPLTYFDFLSNVRDRDITSGIYIYTVGTKIFTNCNLDYFEKALRTYSVGMYSPYMSMHLRNFIFIRMIYEIKHDNDKHLIQKFTLWIELLNVDKDNKLARFDVRDYGMIPLGVRNHFPRGDWWKKYLFAEEEDADNTAARGFLHALDILGV